LILNPLLCPNIPEKYNTLTLVTEDHYSSDSEPDTVNVCTGGVTNALIRSSRRVCVDRSGAA